MESEVPQHYQQTTEFDSDQVQLYKTSQETTAEGSHATKQSDNQNHNIPNERVREYEHREPLYQRHGFVHHHAEQVQVLLRRFA